MIHKLSPSDLDAILKVINSAVRAYRGVVPDDLWKEPYMSKEELKREIDSDIEFYGWFENNALLGAMSIQFVKDVTLIRHAYVLPECQRRGIGSKLLRYLIGLAKTSEILIGTWQALLGLFAFMRSTTLSSFHSKKKTSFFEHTGIFLRDR